MTGEHPGGSWRFLLYRLRDLSGVSGTGPVADGCMFGDGTVVVHWRGDKPSTNVWHGFDQALGNAMDTHGHGGATTLIWKDDPGEE